MTRSACIVSLNLLVAGLLVDLANAETPNGLSVPFPFVVNTAVIDLPQPETVAGRYDSAFPWWGDFHGDGRSDLLIGQHTFAPRVGQKKSTNGLLRIYKNTGKDQEPRLSAPIWFDDLVPTGRIPSG